MDNITLEEVRKIFEGDRCATENGAVIDQVGPHSATCSLTITASHRNAMGAVMGGLDEAVNNYLDSITIQSILDEIVQNYSYVI